MSVRRATPNRAPLDDAGRALAGDPEHVRLAERIAGRAARRHPHLADDFHSAAKMALCEAATRFDPALGKPFAAFAQFRIKGAVLDVFREMSPSGFKGGRARAPTTLSLDLPDAQGRTLSESVASGDGPVDLEATDPGGFDRLIEPLAPEQRRVVSLHFNQSEFPVAEAAAMLGISPSHYSRILKESLAMLRNFHGNGVASNGVARAPAPAARPESSPKIKTRRSGKGRNSSYRGVTWDRFRDQWRARITVNGHRHEMGYFNDEKDAAAAYDRAAIKYHGDKAKVNFPRPTPATGRARPGRRTSEGGAAKTSAPRPTPTIPAPAAGPDHELDALIAITAALSTLDAGAVRRVLGYTVARFDPRIGSPEMTRSDMAGRRPG